MSAPPADVVDRLERLAVHAPVGGDDPDALWRSGRRRERRQWAALTACAVVLAGLAALAAGPVIGIVDPPVADTTDSSRPILPDVVRQPGKWEPAFGRAPGRLIAVGVGTRSQGLASADALWGVSAATGESRWLDLPAVDMTDAVLSRDGRSLAYWTSEGRAGAPVSDGEPRVATGLAIVDLVTGTQRSWDAGSRFGIGSRGLAWAGDTLWFGMGTFKTADKNSFRETTRTWRAGEPGPDTAPEKLVLGLDGSVPAGDGFLAVVATATRHIVHVTDAGERRTIRLVQNGTVFTPRLSPDQELVAGIQQGRNWATFGTDLPLLVGTVDGTRSVMEKLAQVEAAYVLGWRSPNEVVVGSPVDRDGDEVVQASVVDVTDGSSTPLLELTGNLPKFTADAWAGDVVVAPAPPFAPDPRVVGGVCAVVLVLCISLWRTVRRRRGHP